MDIIATAQQSALSITQTFPKNYNKLASITSTFILK